MKESTLGELLELHHELTWWSFGTRLEPAAFAEQPELHADTKHEQAA